MKILVVRPWGRTAFEMGHYCKDALLEIGHAAELFTYNDERISSRMSFFKKAERLLATKSLCKRISSFKPRLILVIKGDRIPLSVIRDIKEKFEIPVANYWIDDPYSAEVSRKISPAYDYFFTNDPDCVQIHKESGCAHVAFLSFGCMPQLHRKIELSGKEHKKYGSDVCFAGTVSTGRIKVLEALSGFDLKIWSPPVVCSLHKGYSVEKKGISRSSPLHSRFTGRSVWGEELVKVYNASKIILNIHFPQTVPIMRDFEVTGCGAFLLTDGARGLENMFNPGEEFICYGDAGELRNTVKYYLSHPGKREEIATRGQARAYHDHTYAVRMKELVRFIEEKKT